MVELSQETRISLLEKDIHFSSQTLNEVKMSVENFKIQHTKEFSDMRKEFKSEIDKLRNEFDESTKDQNKILEDIHERLTDLDKWRWIVVGAAAIIGFIISKITNVIGYNIH